MPSNYFNATSPDFQNEIIDIGAHMLYNNIAENMQETGFFSIIAYASRSYKTEQLSVCIR